MIDEYELGTAKHLKIDNWFVGVDISSSLHWPILYISYVIRINPSLSINMLEILKDTND
jgi:hypothetical protein